MKTFAQMTALFQSIKSYILIVIIFLFPLFFLPITQEFFITNKLYLLSFGAIILLVVSTLEFLATKKLTWVRGMFDGVIIFFVFAIGLSIFISSPNKIQALLNPNAGLVVFAALAILYFYIRKDSRKFLDLLSISSLVVSVIAIIFFLNPLKGVNLPVYLQFLKTPNFNTVGSLLDLSYFLGFFIFLNVGRILSQKKAETSNSLKTMLPSILSLFVIGTALALALFSILKPANGQSVLVFPPLSISWYAAVEILKNPMSAFFGVGIDNFSSIFAVVKDASYNASSLWQIQSFNSSRSAILHVFTEAGMFGIVAFGLLLLALSREVIQRAKSHSNMIPNMLGLFYLLAVIVLFPPSIMVFFLLFIMAAVIAHANLGHSEANTTNVNLSAVLPVYLGFAIIAFVLIGGSAYLLARSYASEYSFKKAINGMVSNNVKDLYENEREAIVLNPYIERFRTNFAQTNLLIANNVASKASTASKTQLSDQDKQTINQAIQAAIAEAKAATSLNPTKATNWENLAGIYRNILNVVQGADVWTISAYQRAIVLDPQNPIYRINLGGVFFSLQNYDQASKMFEQAVALKPDWSNAHYNLAWAYEQKKDYQGAVNEMQNVLSLLDPKKDEVDYKKAQKDLEDFKSKLPKQESTSTQSGEVQQPNQLSLPTSPASSVEPKIQLPKEVSP